MWCFYTLVPLLSGHDRRVALVQVIENHIISSRATLHHGLVLGRMQSQGLPTLPWGRTGQASSAWLDSR